MRLVISVAAALASAAVGAVGGEKGGEAAKELAAFKEYLGEHYPKKKWMAGPAAMATAEVAKAYPGRRFYYVASWPPQPPGAPIKDLIEAYQKRMEEYQRDHLSLTVAFDAAGKITPYAKAADFNEGLMPVKNDDDARTAAVAILSVYGAGGAPPRPVAAKDVMVSKGEKGWQCSVSVQNSFAGNVNFDAAGRCTAVSKVSTVPPPP